MMELCDLPHTGKMLWSQKGCLSLSSHEPTGTESIQHICMICGAITGKPWQKQRCIWLQPPKEESEGSLHSKCHDS